MTTTPTTSTTRAVRCSLPRPTVITTTVGARRLGGAVRGLDPWDITRLDETGKPTIEVTATPCRHGPPLSRPLAGYVIGFALRWDGQRNGVVWVSGDTVLYNGVRQVADRFDVDVAIVHMGGVKFPITGPVRYSMTARDAVELCGDLRPRVGHISMKAATRSNVRSAERRANCAMSSD
jgi:L-ascorbate metabolism protein UlaG (beta-lactamase superfamily)